jgi:hypothetical protein
MRAQGYCYIGFCYDASGKKWFRPDIVKQF